MLEHKDTELQSELEPEVAIDEQEELISKIPIDWLAFVGGGGTVVLQ